MQQLNWKAAVAGSWRRQSQSAGSPGGGSDWPFIQVYTVCWHALVIALIAELSAEYAQTFPELHDGAAGGGAEGGGAGGMHSNWPGAEWPLLAYMHALIESLLE